MPVEDDIDFRKPLSDAQVDKLHKQADQLEKDAERAERAAQKQKEAAEKAQQANTQTSNILGTKSSSGMYDKSYRPRTGYDSSTMVNNTGALPRGGLEEQEYSIGGGIDSTLQQSLDDLGISTKGGYRRVGETGGKSGIEGVHPDTIKAQMMNDNMALKEAAKLARQNAQDVALMKANQAKLMQGIQGGFGKVQEGFSFAKNPMGFTQNKGLMMLGKAGIYGAIAAMVIQQIQGLYQQVIDQIKDMYKPGGILDVRKEVLDANKQVASLKSVIDLEQGRVFFTSGTGEIMRQGVPQATNTENRLNGYKQYLQEYER